MSSTSDSNDHTPSQTTGIAHLLNQTVAVQRHQPPMNSSCLSSLTGVQAYASERLVAHAEHGVSSSPSGEAALFASSHNMGHVQLGG